MKKTNLSEESKKTDESKGISTFVFVLVVLGIVLIIFVLFGCGKKCPDSCDDGNSCTTDVCSAKTNYVCTHEQISCSDNKQCTKDYCAANVCHHDVITPCCGNGVCESGENHASCYTDCELSKEECLKFTRKDSKNPLIEFTYYDNKCKTDQILFCSDSANLNNEFNDPLDNRWARIWCYIDLASEYSDDSICEYLTRGGPSWQAIGSYDAYWYCMAKLRYGKSACSHIESNSWLEGCLKVTS